MQNYFIIGATHIVYILKELQNINTKYLSLTLTVEYIKKYNEKCKEKTFGIL